MIGRPIWKIDVDKGKTLIYSNCLTCHKMEEVGGEIGPILTNIHDKYDKRGLFEAIADPDAGIAFGSEPYLVTSPKHLQLSEQDVADITGFLLGENMP